MSLTATTVKVQPSSTASSSRTAVTQVCDKCGTELSHAHPGVAEDAQKRIVELEAQVKFLTGKATAAGKICVFTLLFESSLDPCRLAIPGYQARIYLDL